MLKIMILEDEKAQTDRLLQFLSNYHDEHEEFEYIAEAYSRGIAFLDAYKCDADLIFLDIRIPDLAGMDVAKKIREVDQNVMIIFVTNLTQYAIEGYSVEAFDYILKPIQYASFSAKLDRALRMLSYREPEISLTFREKEGGKRIPAGTITYVEVCAHDLLFHTGNGAIKQWGTLSKYEALLKSAHFARCHTSYLVILKFVRSIRKDSVDVAGVLLPISRPRRKEFLTAFAQYKGGAV